MPPVLVTRQGEAAYQAARPLWRSAQTRMRELAGADSLAALHGLIETMLPQFADAADADE